MHKTSSYIFLSARKTSESSRVRVYTSLVLGILLSLLSCKRRGPLLSKIRVINGEKASKPEDVLGTYELSIRYQKGGGGTASAVALSQNTFITVAHNFIHPVEFGAYEVSINDLNGNTLAIFRSDVEEGRPKLIFHEEVVKPEGDEIDFDTFEKMVSQDLAALVFEKKIPENLFTHGIAKIIRSKPKIGDVVQLQGNGISDFRFDFEDAETDFMNSGTLRFGSNKIHELRNGLIIISGVSTINPQNPGQDVVSGPGDSGGFLGKNDRKQAIVYGIIQGPGWNRDNWPKNASEEQEYIKSAISLNRASTRAIDLTDSSHKTFFETIKNEGGSFEYEGQ